MDTKQGNISYNFVACKDHVKNYAVSIGFEVDTNASACNLVKGKFSKIYESITEDKFDAAAVCKAICIYVEMTFEKNVVEEVKSKIKLTKWGYNNGQFYLGAQCDNPTAVRKFIRIVLKLISPTGALYKIYKSVCEDACVKSNKEGFLYQCNKINKELAKSVNILIIGNAKLTKERFMKIAETTGNKLIIHEIKNPGTRRSATLEDFKPDMEYSKVKLEGVTLFIFKRFVEHVTKETLEVVDGALMYPSKLSKHLDSIKDKESFKEFVNKKYSKYSSDLLAIVLYSAVMHNIDSPKKLITYKNVDLNKIMITK